MHEPLGNDSDIEPETLTHPDGHAVDTIVSETAGVTIQAQ